MNIVFVCHGDLTSQSTYHVLSIAEQLIRSGHHCIVCIPSRSGNEPSNIRVTSVPIRDFEESIKNGLSFPDGSAPTLIHCWTPREQVRRFTERLSQQYGCPYFVHLEDNEREILNRELIDITYKALAELPVDEQENHIQNNKEIRIHPYHHWVFLKNAAGCTVLIDRLKEHVPVGTPVQLFWPGYDDCFSSPLGKSKEDLKKKYGIAPSQFVVLYSGAFHGINYGEICRMVTALKILINRGMPLCFVKTGHNEFPDLLKDGIKKGWVKDLGFLPRESLPELYGLSDVLIQPGRSDSFNEYRFPSKLPEALASKLPVILPHCNLGLVLKDGVEALISYEDSMEKLIDNILYLYENPEEKERIGANGWMFCKENLNWEKSAGLIASFYDACLSRSREDMLELGLIQTETTDFRLTTSTALGAGPEGSLRGPVAPKDIYLLFLEESRLNGNGSILADGATLRASDQSKAIFRSKRKVKKYKRISIIELMIILVLLSLLLYV